MAARPILIFLLYGAVATANASPRTDPTAGRAVFTGATLPNATSISLNPAALGTGRTDDLYVALTAVLEQLGIDRKAIDLATDSLVDADRVRDTQFGPGGMIAFVWHPGERGTLGLEVRTPPPELFPDDPALRYHSLGTRQRNYVATIATSLKVTSAFYFGASLSHDTTVLDLRYARDTALDRGLDSDCDGAPCGLENPVASELYQVDVKSPTISTENLKVNIGILMQIWRDTWLGIAYHNTPGFGIQTRLDGDMVVTRAPRDGGLRVRGDSTVYVSYPASVDTELRARILPDLDLHVGGRWEDLSRMQAYDVRGFGRNFRDQDIPEWVLRPRGFHDSFALWAGVEQVEVEARKRFRFGGRLGIETSALDGNRTSPGNVSPTSFSLDLGAQARIARNWIVQLSYGLQLFPGVGVEDSAYDPRFAVACADTGFDYSTRACEALRNGYAIPTAAGDYTRFQHAFRLGLRYEIP